MTGEQEPRRNSAPKQQRVTLFQVAELADVSHQTVSRVINNKPEVNEKTRARVWEAVNQLGYRPSFLAQSLARKNTNVIGVVTIGLGRRFFSSVIVGVEAKAHALGYMMLLGGTAAELEVPETDYLRLLLSWHVDGLLFIGRSTPQTAEHLHQLQQQGFPIVQVGGDEENIPGVFNVGIDNQAGVALALSHLLDLGHQQIATISGPAARLLYAKRTQSFRAALAEANIMPQEALILSSDGTYKGGLEATERLIATGHEFSALFAQNDEMALGALKALRLANLSVPEAVSLVGFDDIPSAEYAAPPLTTIRQPLRGIGQVGIEVLHKVIQSDGEMEVDTDLERIIRLSVELVQRESTMVAQNV